jgi:hypothetical protein
MKEGCSLILLKQIKMKNKIILFVFSICMMVTFFSCATLGSVFKKEKKEEFIKSTVKEKDSSSVKVVSKAIKDDFSLKIGKLVSNDSILDLKVNERVNQILGGIDISKTSGDNAYRVWWDSKKNKLRVWFSVGETTNETNNTMAYENKKISYIKEIKEEWKKVILPWWFWLIIVFFFRKTLFSSLKFFIPGLKNATSIVDIFKPKEK